jgi:DNA polymerase-3 subunit epsilon
MWWKKTKRPVPTWWRTYEQKFRSTPPLRTPIRELSFVVFDTETTGLDPQQDQILSLGAVRVTHQKVEISDHLDLLVNADPSKTEAIPIHGILPQANLSRGISAEELLQTFVDFAGSAILIGHHVGFDRTVLNAVAKKTVGRPLKNKTLDTATLAIRTELGRNPGNYRRSDYSLDRLCERYQLPDHDRHTAAGDALITALLFMKLLVRLERKGVTTLRDLLR